MEDIRIAVVGLGSRALHTWIPLLQGIEGYRIVSLCDPIAALHEPALARLEDADGVTVTTNYADVLANPDIEAVALCVRCKEQGALAAQALEAGKHVSSEVPAAHTIEDCWRIVVAAERNDRVYLLAEQTRYWGYVQAWRSLVASGQLGDIVYCEGQYFHYYLGKHFPDPTTGQCLTPQESATQPAAEPGWMSQMPPIHYLPHELSPMLHALDDRVVEVIGMGRPTPSELHPRTEASDLQVALMRTAKGTLMRMAASFQVPFPERNYHWQQLIGTKGSVEWSRSLHDSPKMWLADHQMHDKADVDWRYERTDAPAEARGTGHGDADYYVHVAFRDAVRGVAPLAFDVYDAVGTAAPAILAAGSIAQGSVRLDVPDFRPGPSRPTGTMPGGD
jgi:predicted dehydrogenase